MAYPIAQVEGRSRDIWKAMLLDCQRLGRPQVINSYGKGYYVDASLAEYVRKVVRGLDFSKGPGKTAMNQIREFLGATGNVVPIGGRRIFVRDSWNERSSIPVGVPFRSLARDRSSEFREKERRLVQRENRLTPEEAGETRPPAPVIVKESKKMEQATTHHPIYGQGHTDPNYPSMLRFADNMVQCTICNKVLKGQGMAPHVKMHDDHKKDEVIAELRAQLESTPTSFDFSGVKVEDCFPMLQQYVNRLQKQVEQLSTRNADLIAQMTELKATPPVNPDTDAKLDLMREVLMRVQKGEVSMFRGFSDIAEALEA